MESATERDAGARRSSRASGGAGERSERELDREEQYDLLTAALIGIAVGAAAALLVSAAFDRPEPHPVRVAMRQSGRMARRGGRAAARLPGAAQKQIGAYLESARSAITDTVESELKDLRRSIRRRRRRLGL
jgi:gas vesicle protein